MSKLQTILIGVSIIGIVIMSLISFSRSKNWKILTVNLIVIGAIFFFLNHYFGFPWSIIEAKGVDQIAIVVVLYLCMLAGMIAQYFYYQMGEKTKKIKFRIYPFIKPLLASPIVFIPFLTTLQNINPDFDTFTYAKLIIFLVAFQNGFFWKTFFDHQERMTRKTF